MQDLLLQLHKPLPKPLPPAEMLLARVVKSQSTSSRLQLKQVVLAQVPVVCSLELGPEPVLLVD
jgi:hypothetical protein